MARRREVVREEPVVYEEKRPPRRGIVGAFASLAGWLIGLTLLAVLVVILIIVLV